MTKIGFLGCGKIGKTLLDEVRSGELGQVVFIQDPFLRQEESGVPVLRKPDAALYRQVDLIVECATADALKADIEPILTNSDLLCFSLTAFSDEQFADRAEELCRRTGHCIYIPHGAILGLDGILDGSRLWDSVSVETTKNPKSLGRNDTERTVLYRGSTRGACKAFPRNVNVHAAVALTGIGFDRTQSAIIADPAVHTNTHVITLKGKGVTMRLNVSSFSEGGVTGKYTPYSACGSLRRILDGKRTLRIV